jgi:hypothetical protein
LSNAQHDSGAVTEERQWKQGDLGVMLYDGEHSEASKPSHYCAYNLTTCPWEELAAPRDSKQKAAGASYQQNTSQVVYALELLIPCHLRRWELKNQNGYQEAYTNVSSNR